MPGGNHTTVPDSGARSTLRPNAIFAVRWVFPAPDGPLTSVVGERTVLGRGDDCQTVLAGSGISRYHAEMMRLGPVALVRDLGSMNGLFVNGRRVKEAPLEPGDVVRLGEWVGVALELEPDDSAPAAYGTIASGLIGGNVLRAAVEPALRAARSDLAIIVEGETGTGKEVVARAVHECERAQRRVRGRQLRGAARAARRGGAVRLPAGRVHGRRPRQPGALPVGAAAGRCCSTRSATCRSPLQAKLLRVLEQREVRAARRDRSRCRSTCASSSRRRSRWRRRWRRALPRRPVRAAGRADRALAAAARSPGRRPAAVRAPAARCGGRQPPGVEPRAGRGAVPLRLAVQRARAGDAGPAGDGAARPRAAARAPAPADAVSRRCSDVGKGDPAGSGRLATQTPSPSLPASGSASDSDGAGKAGDRDDEDFARLLVSLRSQGGNVSRAAGAIGISRQRAYRLMQAHPEVNLPGLRGTDGKLRGTPGAG